MIWNLFVTVINFCEILFPPSTPYRRARKRGEKQMRRAHVKRRLLKANCTHKCYNKLRLFIKLHDCHYQFTRSIYMLWMLKPTATTMMIKINTLTSEHFASLSKARRAQTIPALILCRSSLLLGSETNVHNLFLIANWLLRRKCQMLAKKKFYIHAYSVKHMCAAFICGVRSCAQGGRKKSSSSSKHIKSEKWKSFLGKSSLAKWMCICAVSIPTPMYEPFALAEDK